MTDDIIELQSKLAYQELQMQQLSEVLIGQQKQLSELSEKIQRLEAIMSQQSVSMIARADEETPPPHY